MDRHHALLAAAVIALTGLSACGGGGGNPGVCAGSFEVCSEGREPGDVVVTTTTTSNTGVPGSTSVGAPEAPVDTSDRPTSTTSPLPAPVDAVTR